MPDGGRTPESRAARKRAQRGAEGGQRKAAAATAPHSSADAAPTEAEPLPPHPWTRWLAGCVAALTAVFAVRRLDDFDTWWHLASGRWIVEHASVPHTDVLSHTVPDHVWINLQWLYDVLLYTLYRIGGADLLVVASAAAFVAALWLVVRNAQVFVRPAVAAVLGLVALLVAEERFMIRPEMASFVLLGLVLHVLLTVRRDEGARLWMLPLLIVIWVNIHSLFIIGLICIGCFAAGAVLARVGLLPREWRRASDPGPTTTRRLLIFGALSLVATVLNPYHVRGTLFPLALLSRITGSGVFQAIGEFRPPFSGYFATWSLGVFQGYFFATVALAIVAAALGLMQPRSRARRSDGVVPAAPGFDVGGALFFCALAYLSTLARRNTGLFAIGATPIVASWVALLADRLKISRALGGARARTAELVAGSALAAACVVLGVYVARNSYYRASGLTKEFGLGVFDANFPVHAVEFAKQMGLPPKLYNDLTAGGYLTWDSGVGGGVFIDGRLEVYDKEFFSKYTAGLNDFSAWQRQVDEFGVSTAVLFHRWANRHGLIAFLSREPRWALVYYDETVAMFVRREGNSEAIARATAAFPQWDARTRARLSAPVDVWGDPIERVTALDTFARLLLTLRDNDRALETWQRLLELGGGFNRAQEAVVRYRVAWLLASKGERANALRNAEIAAKLAPDDENIKRLLQRLGT